MRRPRGTAWTAGVVALALATGGAAAADPVPLFVEAAGAELSSEQRERRELYAAAAGATTVRVVAIDAAAILAAERLALPGVAGPEAVLARTGLERREGGNGTWVGESPAAGAHAVLVVRGAAVVGSVRRGEALDRVRPLGGGLHALIGVDLARLPADHPPEGAELARREMPPEAGAAAVERARAGDLADPCDTIDLVVAYTAAARVAAGHVEGLLELAVAETNRSYAASGIAPRLRIVHAYETDYVESGSLAADGLAFRIDGDGALDEIHELRDARGGDVAVLLVGGAESGCGLAAAILANASSPFAVVRQDCAADAYALGHEIGHLQGARHNPEDDPNVSPFPHGHGFLHLPGRWRTLMASDCDPSCGALRRPVWSSPALRLDGVAAGTAAVHDNARVLNETACWVASFRAAPGRERPAAAEPEGRPGRRALWALASLAALAAGALWLVARRR